MVYGMWPNPSGLVMSLCSRLLPKPKRIFQCTHVCCGLQCSTPPYD